MLFLCFHLIGVVVSCVVEVVTDGRGQHDKQVDAVHLTPQVSQPDQSVHLSGRRRRARNDASNKPGRFPQRRCSGDLTPGAAVNVLQRSAMKGRTTSHDPMITTVSEAFKVFPR